MWPEMFRALRALRALDGENPFLCGNEAGGDNGGGGGGGGGGGAGDPPPKKTELPPSKHDEPLKDQQTFPREYVEELRTENKTWRGKLTSERQARTEAETAATAAKAAADAATAAAKATADAAVAEANKKAEERVVRSELKAFALEAGMVDLDGLKLADLSTVKLEGDEVKGAKELIEKLKTDKPWLFGKANGTSNSKDNPPPKPGDTKPAVVKEMTKEQYAAAKAAAVR